MRAASPRVLQFLEHQNGRSSGDDKTVTLPVEGAGADRRIGLGGQGAHPDKGQDAEEIAVLRAGDKDNVLAIRPNPIERRAERVRG